MAKSLVVSAGMLNWPQGWLLMFLAYPFIIVKRIRNVEEVLTAELPGYAAYKQQVKWRLMPFIW